MGTYRKDHGVKVAATTIQRTNGAVWRDESGRITDRDQGRVGTATVRWVLAEAGVTIREGSRSRVPTMANRLPVNGGMRKHVIPHSYQVHIRDPRYPRPSDHRLVTVAIETSGAQ